MTALDPRRFLYRTLDPDGARRLAATHLSAHDDGELYLQYSASEAFGFDDGRLKTADYHSSSGFGLRGVTGETTAFAHANEISEAAIERAASTLKLLDPAQGPRPRPRRQRTNQAMYGADDPLSLVPFADKVALCQQIDAAARARDPRVAQVSVSLAASWSVIDIVRADGFVASDVRPLVRLGVQIVAEQEWPARDRLPRSRRPLSLRPPVRGTRVEPGDRHRACPGAGQPRFGCGARRRDAGRARPGLARRAAARSGRPRPRRRFQPQGHLGLFGPHRRARCSARRHGDRRRRDGSAARLADDRRRRHADAPQRPDRGRHPQRLSPGPAERPADGHGADRQRPPRELRPRADAAHDQHLHARRQGRSRRAGRARDGRHLRQELRRRAGRHHQRQVRLLAAPRPTGSAAARSPSRSRARR